MNVFGLKVLLYLDCAVTFCLGSFNGQEGDIFALLEEKVNAETILELYIPTIKSENEICRNHSLYYLENLKKFTLWATEMFDASAKFPNGMLHGSTYELGNYDECTEVRVPYKNSPFQGKYCLAYFKVVPPQQIGMHHNINFELDEYQKYYNISSWEKISAFSKGTSRSLRNEVYFSFCLPSSCSNEDLKAVLQDFVNIYNTGHDFKLEVDVDSRSCQVQQNFVSSLTTADIIFIIVALLPVLLTLIASVYEFLLKLDDFENSKLNGNLHRILFCFSLPSNINYLSAPSKNKDGLDCMAGLKVISMFFIILGHRCMFVFGSPLVNPSFLEQMYTRVEASVLLNGPIIVDTFFVISGFLAVYLILVKLDNTNGRVNMSLIYIHRFIRLYPPYLIILGFYCTLFVKIGSGPLWQEKVGLEQERCSNNWWANLLFLNNYVNADQMCMFQSWFIDCDIHFFLITPLIAWLLWKKPRTALTIVFFIILTCIFIAFSVVYINDTDAILLLYRRLMKDPVSNIVFRTVYIPSHMRGSPYFVGVVTAYVKYQMKVNGKKIPKYGVYCGWIVSVLVILATVYSGFVFYVSKVPMDNIFTAFYASTYHFTWSACIAWIIIAVSSGYGAWIEPILTWSALTIFSRITYTTFLVHGAVQIFTAATIRTPVYAGIFHVVYQTCGDIMGSYILGFVLSMLYEAPVFQLEKVFFGKAISDKNDNNITHKDTKNENQNNVY